MDYNAHNALSSQKRKKMKKIIRHKREEKIDCVICKKAAKESKVMQKSSGDALKLIFIKFTRSFSMFIVAYFLCEMKLK